MKAELMLTKEAEDKDLQLQKAVSVQDRYSNI